MLVKLSPDLYVPLFLCIALQFSVKDVCGGRGDILLNEEQSSWRTIEITVEKGRSVFLVPEQFGYSEMHRGTICRMELLNEPITQRVGLFEPPVFDCFFKQDSVKYTHFGSPLLSEDVAFLRSYRFDYNDTIITNFKLVISILDTPYVITVLKNPLIVNEFYGVSFPIDENVLEFNSNESNGVCKVRFAPYSSRLPAYGQLVSGDERRPVEAIKRSCKEFVHLGLRYKHMTPPTPDRDFVLLVVESFEKSVENQVVLEWVQIPVLIVPGFPNIPPKVAFSSSLLLDADQFVLTPITETQVAGHDEETSDPLLVFSIIKQLGPNEGHVVHLADHTKPIQSFHQADLENHNIAYKPPNRSFADTQMFTLGLKIIDAEFNESEPVTLHIALRPSMTTTPHVSINSGLVLLEGQSRPIWPHNLEIVGQSSGDIKIFVAGGLRHGRLKNKGEPCIAFTLDDIANGLVVYEHDDSDTTKDDIFFRIADGVHNVYSRFPISIIPNDDTPPALIVNMGLSVMQGSSKVISSDVLSAVDQDSVMDHVIYHVINEPKFGQVVKKFPWDREGRRVRTFLQSDLNRELIHYYHSGGRESLDDFEIVMQDSHNPPNESPLYKVTVHIEPVVDGIPHLDPTSLLLLMVKETEPAVITQDILHYIDADSPPQDVIFTVTSPPRFVERHMSRSAGKITRCEYLLEGRKAATSVVSFTQEEVNHMKICYLPPEDDVGASVKHVQFAYIVGDAYGNSVSGNVFNVTILPVNNQSPVVRSSPLMVVEGGNVSLSQNKFFAYDPDTHTEDLLIKLQAPPKHGSILKDNTILLNGSKIFMDNILRSQIRYHHDGSEVTEDSFILSISDGKHIVSERMIVNIFPVDDEPPVIKEPATNIIHVKEGSYSVINSSIVAAEDADTAYDELIFVIIDQPKLGHIVVSGNTTNMFTQYDVRHNSVFYMHSGNETGVSTVYDKFTFVVTDHIFSRMSAEKKKEIVVAVEPVNNQPPIVVAHNKVMVEEGRFVKLTPFHIITEDVDTPAESVECVITSNPQFGYLENTKPSPGSEKSNTGNPIVAFSLVDLLGGMINYVQSLHSNVEPVSDSFSLYCTDCKHQSPTATVEVEILQANDEEPVIYATDMTVLEGGRAAIDDSVFTINDADTPFHELMISVSQPPRHGSLLQAVYVPDMKRIVEVQFHEISVSEWQRGKFYYQHDNSESFSDIFSVVISDGIHEVSKTVKVTIIPINDELPRLRFNQGINFTDPEVNELKLTSGLLLASDIDTSSVGIFYEVVNLPEHGAIVIQRVNGSNGEEEISGRETLSFSQHDINAGRVLYIANTGTRALKDSFTFRISDGVHISSEHLFFIYFMYNEKDNLQVETNTLEVKYGGEAVVSLKQLNAFDNSNKPEEIFFYMVDTPLYGDFRNIDQPDISVQNFTMLEILSGKIVYDVESSQNLASIQSIVNLIVSNGVQEEEVSLPIKITETKARIPVLEVIHDLVIEEDKSAVFTSTNLQAHYMHVKADDIMYIISKHPKYGMLLRSGKKIDSDTFSQEEINDGLISYHRYPGSGTDPDHFLFKVTYNNHSFYHLHAGLMTNITRFNIQVSPHHIANVQVLMSSPDELEFLRKWKQGFVIARHNLRTEVNGMNKGDVYYKILAPPSQGYLADLTTGTMRSEGFHQYEVDKGVVAYMLDNPDTGVYHDEFIFLVVDKMGRVLSTKERFFIQWSEVAFTERRYSACENERFLTVEIKRTGFLHTSSFLSIKAVPGLAVELEDFVVDQKHQIQFNPGVGNISIQVSVVEDVEEELELEDFHLLLHNPINTVIGNMNRTTITIYDDDGIECLLRAGERNFVPSYDISINHAFGGVSESSQEEEDSQVQVVLQREEIGISTFNPALKNTSLEYTEPPEEISVEEPEEGEGRYYSQNGRGFTVSENKDFVKVLQEINCPKNWNEYGGFCYKHMPKKRTWKEAEKACVEKYAASLTSVLSEEHNQWLYELTNRQPAWIGLTTEDMHSRWHFVGNHFDNFTFWEENYPRKKPKQLCALLGDEGFWINRSCNKVKYPFICCKPQDA